jgi:hypothetical protein
MAVKLERCHHAIRVLQRALDDEVRMYEGTGVEAPNEILKALLVSAEVVPLKKSYVLLPQNYERQPNRKALEAIGMEA